MRVPRRKVAKQAHSSGSLRYPTPMDPRVGPRRGPRLCHPSYVTPAMSTRRSAMESSAIVAVGHQNLFNRAASIPGMGNKASDRETG